MSSSSKARPARATQQRGPRHDKPYQLDGRSDVWSLGAILYEILTYEHAYVGSNIFALMMASQTGPPVEPRQRAPRLDIPKEIEEVCLATLEADRDVRVGSAEELRSRVQAFLDGSRRRQRALEIIEETRGLDSEANEQRQCAQKLRNQAEELLEDVPLHANVDAKRPAWELEDRATALEREAERWEVEFRYGSRR